MKIREKVINLQKLRRNKNKFLKNKNKFLNNSQKFFRKIYNLSNQNKTQKIRILINKNQILGNEH